MWCLERWKLTSPGMVKFDIFSKINHGAFVGTYMVSGASCVSLGVGHHYKRLVSVLMC